ncbi:MAG: Calx-beta domain-containing protein, partial [Candidatus Paceibacterota bacterium]
VLGSNQDIVGIRKRGATTKSTEIQAAGWPSDFQTYVLPTTGTVLHETGANFEFEFKDISGDGHDDLIAIKQWSTGSNTTEVHVLNSASGNNPPMISASGTGTFTDAQRPKLSWNATDPDGAPLRTTARIKRSGVNLFPAKDEDQGSFTYGPGWGLGTFELWGSTKDSGNKSASLDASQRPKLTIEDDDNEAPEISIESEATRQVTAQTQEFRWHIQDKSGFSARFRVLHDGTEIHKKTVSTDSSATQSYSFNFDQYGPGQFQLIVDQLYDRDRDRSLSIDRSGPVSVSSALVNVENTPPEARFQVTPPSEGMVEGAEIIFDASASLDFDGDPLDYVWNLGDGTFKSGAVVTHRYADDGAYNVTLAVDDKVSLVEPGGGWTTTETVTVSNVVPTVSGVPSSSAHEAEAYALTLAVDDPGDDTATIQVDWGDGNVEQFASGGVKEHVYVRGGQSHTIRVAAADEDGVYADLYVTDVDVLDAPPQVVLPSFFTATAGNPITASAAVVDGVDDTLTYLWSFGDGQLDASGVDLSTVSHTYSSDGEYPLTLTVTDSEGLSTTVDADVVIGEPVSFTLAQQTAAEGAGTLTVTAELQNGVALGHRVTIPLVVGGSATAGDYTLSDTAIVIEAGETTGSVELEPSDDALDEDDETLVLTMGRPVGASLGTIASQEIEIADNDVRPSVFFTSASGSIEESAGTVRVSAGLSEVSGRDVIVPLTVSGTAWLGLDFGVPDPLEIRIPAGQLSGSVNLVLVDDDDAEDAESILLAMQPSGQAVLSTEPGRSTTSALIISQNDYRTVSAQSVYRLASEGSPTFLVRARLSVVSDQQIEVPFTLSGSATAGVDYSIAESKLIFRPGELFAAATVQIQDDSLVEETEEFTLQLGEPDGAILGTATAVLTDILDNDLVRVNLAGDDVTEWEGGSVPIEVKLSNLSDDPVRVRLSASGTVSPNDFDLAQTELIIQPGQPGAFTMLTLSDDMINEATEWLFVRIEEVQGGFFGSNSSRSVTIRDNDPLVRLEMSENSRLESSGSVKFLVSLSAETNRDVLVPLLYGGEAQKNVDFLAPSSVQIQAGSTKAEVELALVDDSAIERPESLFVQIGSLTAGKPDTVNSASLVVNDDDRPEIHWASPNYSAFEEDGSLELILRMSQAAATNVVAHLSYTGVTATAGTDFSAGVASVVIPAGEAQIKIPVTVINDSEKELFEIFEVAIADVQGANLPSDPAHRRTAVTVTDVDSMTLAEVQRKSTELSGDGQELGEELLAVAGEGAVWLRDWLWQDLVPYLLNDQVAGGLVAQVFGVQYRWLASTTWGWFRERYPTGMHDVDQEALREHFEENPSGFWRELSFAIGRKGAEDLASALLGMALPDVNVLGFDVLEPVITNTSKFLNEKWGLGEHFESGRENLEDVVTGKKKILGVRLSAGYGNGATVFFDMDFNGARSADEPFGFTSADGFSVVGGIDIADSDNSGTLETSEGQWVTSGGTDTSVQASFRVQFRAPPGVAAISPLSTLLVSLINAGDLGRTLSATLTAEERVASALGLGVTKWATRDFIGEAAKGG